VAGQNITFDFLTRGADSTAAGFRKVGDNTVLAAKGARVLADAIEKLGSKEDRTAAESKLLASALRQTGDAEDRVAARAVLADAAIRRLDDSMQDSSKTAAKAGAGFGSLAGAGGIPGGGMGAAIAAGVVLSPVIATLGTGLAGFGLAAAGAAKPIADAAGKTGGLAANMSKLNPEQRALATSILGLGKQYHQFEQQMQPEVLSVFNAGIKLAGGLLKDVQPVAAATGKALGGFLGQVDTEFRSRTWQQFFGFMADTAGPDMKLLTANFVDLMHVLPPLLEDLQPLATGFLQASDNALKLAGSIASFGKSTDKTSNSVGTNVGLLGFLSKAVANVTNFMHPGGVATGALNSALAGIPGNAGKAGTGLAATAVKAQSYAQWVQASAKATTALATAQSAAVSTQLAYGNDILTSANDAQTFHDKLRASAGQIGLHTQAQRDSFGAANTYIGDLSRQATSAIASGHGTNAAIAAIRGGLPVLDSAKTKNQQYWQEVRTLVGYLNKLSLIKFINTPIHVTGSGKWSVTGTSITPGVAHGPQNIGAAPGAATGLYINRGTGPTADDVMIRASKGELVVPTHMVRAGAVDHLRGQIPGFAAGGVAGSYGPGKVAGLPPWIGGRINATDTAIAQNTAQAILNAMAAAQKAGKAITAGGIGNYKPGAGVQQWRGVVQQALGLAGANVAQLTDAVLYQMQTESGGNPTIVNRTDSNWIAGHPSVGLMQVIRGTFAAYAGRYRNVGPFEYGVSVNPLANVYSAIKYAQSNYGPGLRNAYGGIGSGHGYALGGLVPGFASGGVAGQGAAYLKAWQTRHGGPYALAVGPKVLNEQIPEMAAAIGRAKTLAGAPGLSAGQHKFWAGAAAGETRLLATLLKERTTERAWRTMLGVNELGLDKEIRAAGSLPSLAKNVRGWKAQMGRDKATVAAISGMLGYSDAYIKAHPAAVPGPVLPGVTHSYGGDIVNSIAPVLAAALGPFTGAARGGMVSYDRGGWLKPGATMAWNGTGRPEQVIPARGGGGGKLQVEWVGGNGGDDLERWIRKNVRIRGGGDVQRAYGSR
jgi:hypothetical protein